MHTSFVLPDGPSPLPTVCHSPSFCRQRHPLRAVLLLSCISPSTDSPVNVPMCTSNNCALPWIGLLSRAPTGSSYLVCCQDFAHFVERFGQMSLLDSQFRNALG